MLRFGGYNRFMNILVFSWRDPKHPLAGGAEQVMHEHMKGWVAAGHNVTLFSSQPGGLRSDEEIDGVKIVRGGFQYLGVQISGFFYYIKNRSNFNFIVDQFHGVPFFTPIYSRKPKLAVIQEIARDVWLKNSLAFPLNLIIGTLGFLFEPIFFLFYRNVPFMTGSDSAKKDLAGYGISRNKIYIVPHGVILPALKPKTNINNKVKGAISFLGILSKDKGIEDAIKCFLLLKDSYNFRFWVIGKGENKDYEKKIRNFAKPLGNRIKFWGYVNESKKFRLLSKSCLLINPSIHEGWGLVNIEANFVGTPVVAYNSAGLVDSIKNGVSGLICERNPSSMKEAILSVTRNRGNYEKLVRGAAIWSKNFDWVRSRQISLNLINDVYLWR